jgi:hypothetical protein
MTARSALESQLGVGRAAYRNLRSAESGTCLGSYALFREGPRVLESARFSAIDDMSTTGLAASADGNHLARLAWTDDGLDIPGALRVYDRFGLLAYHRVDDLREPHSALLDGDVLVMVSTRTNAILWLDRAGRIGRQWKAPGEGDCWHVNSLTTHRGRLLASAFGRFDHHRGWGDPTARIGQGIVIDARSGRDALTGLYLREAIAEHPEMGDVVRATSSRASVIRRRSIPACRLGLVIHALVGDHV